MTISMLNQQLPPVPQPADLQALGALVKFVSEMIANPKQARELVDGYLAGAAKYQEAYERELALRRQNVAEKTEFEARLVRDRKHLDAAMEAERDQISREHAQRRAQLDKEEQEIAKLKQQAQADAVAAQALRREFESKLAKLSALAAA
jgi:hypothetical protein